MADESVIYSRRSGGPRVPVAVRIEWLADGTINPLRYWTPDGTCFKVIVICERVQMAFLKDGGEGLRFKVQSEIIETPDAEDALLHTRHESCLYLADKRFSQKNIIDGRYGHAGKEYIPVVLDVFPDGGYELVYFSVRGKRYMVEKTDDIAPRGCFNTGGVGLWHKVKARLVNAGDDGDPDPEQSVRRSAALYLELDKWFVSVARQGGQ